MQAIQSIIGFLYYVIVAVIAIVVAANFVRTRDTRKTILYAIVLAPFVLRVLHIK